MNIVLVPYNWTRHIVVAIAVGTAALLTWWGTLMAASVFAPMFGFAVARCLSTSMARLAMAIMALGPPI